MLENIRKSNNIKITVAFVFFITLTLTCNGFADFMFQPYMGLAAGNLSYGNKKVFDGGIQNYILGLKGGIALTQNLFLFADYSRNGPVNYLSKSGASEFSSSKAVFNIFSGGGGLELNLKSFFLSYGVYPYDQFIEYTRDFRFKGGLQRISIGIPLANNYKVHFYYDSHIFNGESTLGINERNLLCNYSLTDCPNEGKLEEVSFVISSNY